MNTETRLKHHELTGTVIRTFYRVYNELGVGFLESVYEQALSIALHEAGVPSERQVEMAVRYHGRVVGEFRADMIVAGLVILEVKAVRTLDPAHVAQLLNYLRVTDLEVGLLLNFGHRPQFRRLLFDNHRKEVVELSP